jgi:hypothetical protein
VEEDRVRPRPWVVLDPTPERPGCCTSPGSSGHWTSSPPSPSLRTGFTDRSCARPGMARFAGVRQHPRQETGL